MNDVNDSFFRQELTQLRRRRRIHKNPARIVARNIVAEPDVLQDLLPDLVAQRHELFDRLSAYRRPMLIELHLSRKNSASLRWARDVNKTSSASCDLLSAPGGGWHFK